MNKELTEAENTPIKSDSKEDKPFKDIYPQIWDLCKRAGMGDYPGSGLENIIHYLSQQLPKNEKTPTTQSNSKEDKQKELEQAANVICLKTIIETAVIAGQNNIDADGNYIGQGVKETVDYIMSLYQISDGANWQSNQQPPTPSTIEQGQQESSKLHPPSIDDEWSMNEALSTVDKKYLTSDFVSGFIEGWKERKYRTTPQSNKAEQGQQGDEPKRGCGICGGSLVLIRGRYPKDDKRLVCPTCNTERLEQINEISSKTYGVAMNESSTPAPPIK